MEDWDALVSELVRQNSVFVASCSIIVWDFFICFGEEVHYIWHCSSRTTKYVFLLCRYWSLCYFMAYLVSGTQWTPQIPIPRQDCRTWFLIHTATVGLLYTGSQLTLIQKVFDLYGRSVRLATSLFILQCIQVTGMFLLSHYISGPLRFDPICNAIDTPNFTFSVLAMATSVQCIIWALILRKNWKSPTLFSPKWRRYLWTSEANAKLSWGVAIAAITFNTTHSLARQRVAPVYVLTFPALVLSVGTCRYILRIERARENPADSIEIDDMHDTKESHSKQRCMASPRIPIQHAHPLRPSPPPSPPIPPPSGPEIPPTQNLVPNYPYLHGAQLYKLNRRSIDTLTITTHNSPRHLSDHALRQPPSARTSRSASQNSIFSSDSRLGSQMTETEDTETQNGLEDNHGAASDIEIGSMHSSSSVDSEELRRFYNETWTVGPFMTGGPSECYNRHYENTR